MRHETMKGTQQTKRRRVMDGALWVFLAELLLLPTGFITTVFLTRSLGPEGFGLFALAAGVVASIELVLTSLLGRATVRFISRAEDWRPVGTIVVRVYLIGGLGMMLLLWLLAGPIARLLNEPALASYLRLFALDIPLFCLARAHSSILVGIGDFRQRALTSAGRWITRLVLIVLLVELGLSVTGAILGSIGGSLVELLVGRIFVRPSPFHPSTFPLRQLWGYAVPLFLFGLSLHFVSTLDLYALKALGGGAALAGIYGAAQTLARLPRILTKALSPLLLSTLGRMQRAGEDYGAKELARNVMRLVILLLPLAGMTAGASLEIVDLVFGPEYLAAAPILSVLIFGAIAFAMIPVASAILTGAGKPRWTFAVTGPLLPLAAAGYLFLIPRMGAMGAALVTTLVASVGALAAVAAVYRIWQVLPPAGSIVRSILICVLAFAVAVLWSTPGFLLLLKLAVIALLIGLAYLLLCEFSREELALAHSMLPWQTGREQPLGEV